MSTKQQLTDAGHVLHVLQSISILADDAEHSVDTDEPYEVLCKKIRTLNTNIKDYVALLVKKENTLQEALRLAKRESDKFRLVS